MKIQLYSEKKFWYILFLNQKNLQKKLLYSSLLTIASKSFEKIFLKWLKWMSGKQNTMPTQKRNFRK